MDSQPTSNNAARMQALRAIRSAKNFDTESAHTCADKALCDLLIELGYEDVVTLWEEVPKWYA